MTRFFFDYTTKDQSLYDYQGSEFRSSQGAIEFAEAIAQGLKHSLTGEWNKWSIEVCTAEGRKIFTLPVEAAAPLAA